MEETRRRLAEIYVNDRLWNLHVPTWDSFLQKISGELLGETSTYHGEDEWRFRFGLPHFELPTESRKWHLINGVPYTCQLHCDLEQVIKKNGTEVSKTVFPKVNLFACPVMFGSKLDPLGYRSDDWVRGCFLLRKGGVYVFVPQVSEAPCYMNITESTGRDGERTRQGVVRLPGPMYMWMKPFVFLLRMNPIGLPLSLTISTGKTSFPLSTWAEIFGLSESEIPLLFRWLLHSKSDTISAKHRNKLHEHAELFQGKENFVRFLQQMTDRAPVAPEAKKIYSAGEMYWTEMFPAALGYLIRSFQVLALKDIQEGLPPKHPSQYIKSDQSSKSLVQSLMMGVIRSVAPGMNDVRSSVTKKLDDFNYHALLSETRKVNIPEIGDHSDVSRRLVSDFWYGFICPVDTPDDDHIGKIVHTSCMGTLSNWIDPLSVRSLLSQWEGAQYDHETRCSSVDVPVLLDNLIVTRTRNTEGLKRFLDDSIRAGKLSPETVHHQGTEGYLIRVAPGRLLVPRIPLNPKVPRERDFSGTTWEQCLRDSAVVYTDPGQYGCIVPACTLSDAEKGATHLELISTAPFSPALTGPFPFHQPGARTALSVSMIKQAMGGPEPSRPFHAGYHALYYPQKTLYTNDMSQLFGMDEHPCSTNVVVAVACFPGNQEDAMIINRASVDRGLFRSYQESLYRENVRETGKRKLDVRDHDPGPKKMKLEEDNITGPGTCVQKGDVLVSVEYQDIDTTRDATVCKASRPGQVRSVCIASRSEETSILTRVSSSNPVRRGDKMAFTGGQKGVISRLEDPENMLFDPMTGMNPDVIINPHGLPSRRTISLLFEILFGKNAAVKGKRYDASPFQDTEQILSEVKNELRERGFSPDGTQAYLDGETGIPIQTHIFTGLAGVHRLKHLVSNKVQCSGKDAPRGRETRGPRGGRANSGSIRFSESDCLAVLASGCSSTVLEKTVRHSDGTVGHICQQCGVFVQPHARSQIGPYADTIQCDECRNLEDIETVHCMPFVNHSMVAHLNALHIQCRQRLTEKD
jgi:DNA-directed RNA polymerase subunit B